MPVYPEPIAVHLAGEHAKSLDVRVRTNECSCRAADVPTALLRFSTGRLGGRNKTGNNKPITSTRYTASPQKFRRALQ